MIASRFCWVRFNNQKLYWKHRKIFALLRFLSGFSFSLFVDIHDWTEAKHDCRPFSAAAESPDEKENNIQLAIISIEMMRDSISGHQATK